MTVTWLYPIKFGIVNINTYIVECTISSELCHTLRCDVDVQLSLSGESVCLCVRVSRRVNGRTQYVNNRNYICECTSQFENVRMNKSKQYSTANESESTHQPNAKRIYLEHLKWRLQKSVGINRNWARENMDYLKKKTKTKYEGNCC